jgi:hypothetical protein
LGPENLDLKISSKIDVGANFGLKNRFLNQFQAQKSIFEQFWAQKSIFYLKIVQNFKKIPKNYKRALFFASLNCIFDRYKIEYLIT